MAVEVLPDVVNDDVFAGDQAGSVREGKASYVVL
jgi:hypothetical protein